MAENILGGPKAGAKPPLFLHRNNAPQALRLARSHQSTTSSRLGTAGHGANWFRTTSDSRVWCRNT